MVHVSTHDNSMENVRNVFSVKMFWWYMRKWGIILNGF
jgi:hypothetical protein